MKTSILFAAVLAISSSFASADALDDYCVSAFMESQEHILKLRDRISMCLIFSLSSPQCKVAFDGLEEAREHVMGPDTFNTCSPRIAKLLDADTIKRFRAIMAAGTEYTEALTAKLDAAAKPETVRRKAAKLDDLADDLEAATAAAGK